MKASYLFPNDYMAEPSAHIFNDRIYVYPSHDRESGIVENDNGDHFEMNDYHVFSIEEVGGPLTDHGCVLAIENIPGAGR